MIIITDEGLVIRMPLNQVTELSRVAQGTRLINLKENQKVSAFAFVENEESAGSLADEQ